jgi:mono/diheme cytochrome c family protein
MKIQKYLLLFVGLTLVLMLMAGCGKPQATPDPNAPKPSNPGGVGQAVNLKGDAGTGASIFSENCAICHGDLGKGGIANPGSVEDVPTLNPIDPGLVNSNPEVFAMNLDLFIEHGSTPEGTPAKSMPAFGDQGILTPQQIADVIAYIIQLNTPQQ